MGNSFHKVVQHFLGQERRWLKDPKLREKSDKFMKEYRDWDHMDEVPKMLRKDTSGEVHYIFYLSVTRKNASMTKLRNVFNALSPSSNGICLNQTIFPGPNLQTHIFDFVTRIRKFEYVFSGDIAKMFRQILLLPDDYGVYCAPWLAIRILHQVVAGNGPDEEMK